MTKTDLAKLKPGTRLRVKRGWGADGVIVRVVEYPANGDPGSIKIKDGPVEHIWSIDSVTLYHK